MVNNINMIRPDGLSICEHDPCQQDNRQSDSQHCLCHHQQQPMYYREKELGMKHHIFKILWNSNFSSPVEERLLAGGACVLIVGTNPSIMTFDLATAYPRSTFIGLEIFPAHSPSPPPSPSSPSIEPPNATILQINTLTSPKIPFPGECFDFVYFHSLMVPATNLRDYTAISREPTRELEGRSRGKETHCEIRKDSYDRFCDEVGLVKDMIRVLKPDGWIEFMRIKNMCACEFGGATRKMINGYFEYVGASAVDTLNFKNLKSLLTSTKRLRKVTNESKDTLLGTNGGRIGELLADTLLNPINSNRSSLSTFMKMSTQEFSEMYSSMNREINEYKAYCQSYRIYSRKI